MSRFAKLYSAVLALSVFALSRDIVFLVLVLTSGLAAPILLFPTFALYLTALWPAIWLRSAGYSTALAWTAGFACIAALAVLPSVLSHGFVRLKARQEATVDVNRRLSAPPRTIKIEALASESGSKHSDPLLAAPCQEICQKLLLGGEVSAVRIVGQSQKSVVYRFEKRQNCPKAFGASRDASPEAVAAALRGECIVPTPEEAWMPTVTLRQTKEPWASPLHGTIARYQLFDPGGGLIAQQAEIRAEAFDLPLAVSTDFVHSGPRWNRSSLVAGATNIEQFLREHAGYRLTLEPARPETDENIVAQLLAMPGSHTFGPELTDIVARYAANLRTPYRREDIALLKRAVADKRVADLGQVGLALAREPSIVGDIVGDVLDRLEEPTVPGKKHVALARALNLAPVERLRPYASRIIAITELPSQVYAVWLLRVVGRLGVDTTDLLRRKLKSNMGKIPAAAAYGACSADEPIAAALLPDIESMVREDRENRTFSARRGFMIIALRMLERSGRRDVVEAFLATRSERSAANFRK